MINIGETLKQYRICADLSQSELAKLTHIKQQNISRWESNLNYPNILDCVTLADFYNINLEELIGKEISNSIKKNNITINSGNNNVITGNGININSSFKNSNNTNTNFSDEEQQIINDFRKLSKDKQAAIKLLLK